MIYADWYAGDFRFFNNPATNRNPLGDDGGEGDVFGALDAVGTYQISATFDRVNSSTPGNVLIDVEVITPNAVTHSKSYDVADFATLNQVGWRNRYNSASVSTVFDNLTVTAVPEPSTLAHAALGLLGLIGFERRRKR